MAFLKTNGKGLLPLLAGKLKNKALAYGYSNARVRAMKANLLSLEELEKMLLVRDTSSIIGLLELTHYKKDIVHLSVKYSGEDLVERALGRNFSEDSKKLLRISPISSRKVVAAMLERYDIANIKTILLGKTLSKKREDILDLIVPAGELKPRTLEHMIDASSTKDAALLLRGTDYEVPYEMAEKSSPQQMVTHLQNQYYKSLAQKVGPYASEAKDLMSLALMEIDAKNIMDNLRCKEFSKRGHSCKIKKGERRAYSGAISISTLNKIHELPGIEEELAEIENLLHLPGLLEDYKKNKSLARIEVAVEKRIAKKRLSAFHRGVLSLGALVGYIFLKEEEVKNIRKIIRGRQYGLSTEQIKETLVTLN